MALFSVPNFSTTAFKTINLLIFKGIKSKISSKKKGNLFKLKITKKLKKLIDLNDINQKSFHNCLRLHIFVFYWQIH